MGVDDSSPVGGLGLRVGGHLLLSLHSSSEMSDHSQWAQDIDNVNGLWPPPHHHNRSTALFPRPPRSASARRELLDFMVQGKLTETDTATNQLGATLSGLTSAHLDHPPYFYVNGVWSLTMNPWMNRSISQHIIKPTPAAATNTVLLWHQIGCNS